ncbi:Zn(2)-C6 fungal-type DNA-binding domain protein [Metarhizium album ARSEF 1941]|uniref:Zn(2)-C6 fungal-type DNA-binding domain protein n=1 Tax=Metarhizium album (strain ARSEF 1941) TaxID=1081103 RepID=A0A0B2WW67_METAS|nr:Zn(2)-C6 fungal-type DNA-binding domain protein [Metarhizium album ARSEF 1941]KHO00437.1 Zn(2)-C6 fungal-type DNA-binding domain protein [Metarhizium album ARSEF 1941]
MASAQSASTLPQGFSVYQSTLGAPLQFFPALGSRQLDDLINAFIPGPSSASEKRAAISLDFLEYSRMTGQAFKFYAVSTAASVATSPSITSPSLDSVNSSFNVSPITSSWDWSATSTLSAASSSRGPTQCRRQSKRDSTHSRHRTNDISHLPGMKILTKDGQDVTNSASRGSKTKEQRDHAHLMRIIKACDSCRRKKIRCDPSHKKRGASQAAPQPASKPAKKARTVPQDPPPRPPPAAVTDSDLLVSSSFDLDSSFDFSVFEDLDPTTFSHDLFDEFIHIPALDTPDFDIFHESGDYVASQSSTTTSSSSAASPLKSSTPSSQPELGAPPGIELVNPEVQGMSPNFPYLESSGASSYYADFNLYSPDSSFSEDERMVPIGASTGSLPSLNENSLSECPPRLKETVPDGEANDLEVPGMCLDEPQLHSASGVVGGSSHNLLGSNDNGQFATTSTAGESASEHDSRPSWDHVSEPVSEVVTRYPGTTTAAIPDKPLPGAHKLDKVPTSFNLPVASASVDVGESPGTFADHSIVSATPSVPIGHGSETPAKSNHQLALVSTNRIHVDCPGETSDSHQDYVASVDSSGPTRSEPAVLSASSDGVQVLFTNSSPEYTEVSTAQTVHNRLTGLERVVPGVSSVLFGTSDQQRKDVAAPEDSTDGRHQPTSALRAQTGLRSSLIANDEPLRGHVEPILDIVGEDAPVSQRSTASLSCDQHHPSSDCHHDGGAYADEPTPGADNQAPRISLNALKNVFMSAVGGEHSLYTGTTHNLSDALTDASLASMAQTAAFMSNLALYVIAAAVTATHGSVAPRTQSVAAPCRIMSRGSSLKVHSMSPLCVV